MKLELVETKNERRKLEIYSLGNYRLKKVIDIDGYESYFIIKESRTIDVEYLPEIYVEYNYSTDNVVGFKIQTTSYGSLNMEETSKVVAGYQEAIEAVKALTEAFVK